MSVLERARELQPDLVRLRRSLHREPELGLRLPRTQEKVLAALDGLPLEITLGRELTSVTAVLRGGRPGGAVLLRGDMDALPVDELTGVEYASELPGRMRGCGHDLHTAGLVGAATLLADRRESLQGDVVFMFQPGEEGHNGAGAMIDEGVLEAAGKPLDAAFALHVAADRLPGGWVASRPGTVMTASDVLRVTVRGEGGHGSAPHHAKDPVPAVCEMVTALQNWVTRTFDIFDPVVVTVGRLHAGTQQNVIPDTAEFEATVRSYSEINHERLAAGLPRLVRGIAAAHGLDVEVSYRDALSGHRQRADRDGVRAGHGARTVRRGRGVGGAAARQRLGGLLLVLNKVPGAMLLVGAAPEGVDVEKAPQNHSPRAVFDDRVLHRQAALLSELAEQWLAAGASA